MLVDFQFYAPSFSNANLDSYPIGRHRSEITNLVRASEHDLSAVKASLRTSLNQIGVSGIIAPAMVYEAAREDIVQLNHKLFRVARELGSELSLPVYASVVLGASVVDSDTTMLSVLSHATSLNCDGWYFAFEFGAERIPSNVDHLKRFCRASLKLAATGKPLLHAFSGPLGIISFGVGATAIGLGYSQNLWKFSRGRWSDSSGQQGGGGDAPPRFFSPALWGTIVFPDEIVQLSAALRGQVYAPTAFSPDQPSLPWTRWEANKHFLKAICEGIGPVLRAPTARLRAQKALDILQNASLLHTQIESSGLVLKDGASIYQQAWVQTLQWVLSDRARDYDYLEFIA